MKQNIHPATWLKLIAIGSLIFLGISQTGCRRYGNDAGFTYKERQSLAPAADAAEWLERLSTDLETDSFSSQLLSNLFAELPPMDQWPAVCDGLEDLAENTADKIRSEKLLLFAALLKDGDADIEPRIRAILSASDISEYRRDEAIRLLLMTSKERVASLEWLRSEKPDILKPRENGGHSEKPAKLPWETALAENRVNEGISLLQAAAEGEADVDDKAELYKKLIRVGIVLGRDPLAAGATEKLTALLMAELETSDSVSFYTYGDVFALPAHRKDWQAIVDVSEKVREILAKKRDSPSRHGFGHMDEAQATYLTALKRLGRDAEFTALMDSMIKGSAADPESFFELLGRSVAGEPPLGVIYLQHLDDPGKSMEWALHLLARKPGTDAFYAYLTDLDKERAKPFLHSLHAYDPYEERPLIWLAEIARREGDLVLAQKTIDEAIALDPSDGDNGKDSRMFCYEILARIHQDSGREDKAVFFRSVVDSIRQGEAADDFLHAGLIREATERYEKALGQFNDAYCLQSRLAMTLARNGRFEESIAHFRKAFELMPLSFGPRESHCFGCEGLFDDPRVVEIALPLLANFEKENPGNARAPYLLGLILEEAGRPDQAALAYRRALKTDPGYYNAALRLLRLLDKRPEDFTEAETLRAEVFRFAPYAEKPKYIKDPSKLRKYWEEAANFPPSPLQLPASPIPTAAPGKDQYVEHRDYSELYSYLDRSVEGLDGWSPAEIRRSNVFLNTLDGTD